MAGISKRTSGSWVSGDYGIMKTATDTITTLPAVIYPNSNSVTIGVKGNTIQNGTPTPQNPVDVNGTGERTENLLPEFYATSGEISGNSYTITKNSIETHNDGSVLGAYYVLSEFKRYGNYANYTPIDEKHSFKIPAGTYTFSGNENIYNRDNGLRLIVGQLGQAVSGASAGAINVGIGQTFTVNADSYVCPVLEIRYDSHVDEYILTNSMLNEGSTALPYEPYDIKIPISCGGTTTPIYLGEVQTERKIQKLVLTGGTDEEYAYDPSYTRFYFVISNMLSIGVRLTPLYCTHYQNISDGRPVGDVPNNSIYTGGGIDADKAFIKTTDYTNAPTFKAWLAQQYANGTPVTVWYVLDTPTTGITNEPLMRIGDYADSLSASIPCTAGENSLDVDTTVQPSEVTATFEGWHALPAAHERSGGAWD